MTANCCKKLNIFLFFNYMIFNFNLKSPQNIPHFTPCGKVDEQQDSHLLYKELSFIQKRPSCILSKI